MSAPAAVELRGLTVRYTRGDTTITPVDALDLSIEPGTLVLLLGPSGCGKTTLLSCLAGIQRPSEGEIRIGDRDIATLSGAALTDYRRHGVGIVFQAFNLVPSLSALDNVAVSIRGAGRPWREARARARELLESVGLGERLHHRPGDLSGGQQQRVAIARALALDPPLVVADEPTANLDHVQVEVVLRLLRGLTERGHTVVVSTHDHRLLPVADRVIDLAHPGAASTPEVGGRLELADGDRLFTEGDRGGLIYEIESGVVVLEQHVDGVLTRFASMGAGECFGEMAALFDLPRSATAIASGAAVVHARTVDEFRAAYGAARLRDLVGRTVTGAGRDG